MYNSIAAMAVAAMDKAAYADFFRSLPSRDEGPIHRRGKHKPNARKQAGRKTLPRRHR